MHIEKTSIRVAGMLIEYIVDLARRESKKLLNRGVIGEHAALQPCYRKRGFVMGESKRFPHLPFNAGNIFFSHSML